MRALYEFTHKRTQPPSRYGNGCELREPLALFFILHVIGSALGGILHTLLLVVRLCSWGSLSKRIDAFHSDQWEKLPHANHRN